MRRFVVALVVLCATAAPARAQTTLLENCAAQNVLSQYPSVPSSVQDQFNFMCAQVVNSLSNVQPTVGIAFSGGNPVLGTATTFGTRLGLIPRVSLTARANVAFAEVPALFDGYVGQISESQSQLPTMGTTGVPIGSIQGDLAVGLFNGISVTPMVSGIGSVDLLGSVAFIPQVDEAGISESIVNWGAGARVGLLRQGVVMPGISVSAMYRRMAEVGFGDLSQGDSGEFSTNLSTLSVRGIISKGVLMFDLALGAGYDRYTSDLGLGWAMTCSTQACLAANSNQPLRLQGGVEGELTTAAWNVFGDLTLDLLLLKLVAEVGYQKAMDVLDVDDLRDVNLPAQPLTTDALDGGRFFGSVGLRIQL